MDSDGASAKIYESEDDIPGISQACEVGVTKCVTYELESTNQRLRGCLDPGVELKMNTAHTADKYSDPDYATKEAFKVTTCTSDHCNTVPNLTCRHQVSGAPFQPYWKRQDNGYTCDPFFSFQESEAVGVSLECERDDFYFNEYVMPYCYNITGTNGKIYNRCFPWSATASWKPTFYEDSECTIPFEEESCMTDNCNTSNESNVIVNPDENTTCEAGPASCFPINIINQLKKIDLSKINYHTNYTCMSQDGEELYYMNTSGVGSDANQSLKECSDAGNINTIRHCLDLFTLAFNCYEGRIPCGDYVNNEGKMVQYLNYLLTNKTDENFDQCMVAADSESESTDSSGQKTSSEELKIRFTCKGYDCGLPCGHPQEAQYLQEMCELLKNTYEYQCVAQCNNANEVNRSLNETNNETYDMEIILSANDNSRNQSRLKSVFVIGGVVILITVIICISICIYFNCKTKISNDKDEEKDQIEVKSYDIK